jgi:hypothetical protein
MKDEKLDMTKEAQISTPNVDTGNLAEAVKWVYKQYGTDLTAFFRDAYKEAARKHPELHPGDRFEAYQQ